MQLTTVEAMLVAAVALPFWGHGLGLRSAISRQGCTDGYLIGGELSFFVPSCIPLVAFAWLDDFSLGGHDDFLLWLLASSSCTASLPAETGAAGFALHCGAGFREVGGLMTRRSAGLLLFRRGNGQLEVLLANPGGPFWQHKDDGSWTVPNGEYDELEDPLAAAQREFHEETGTRVEGKFLPLGEVK